MQDEINAIIEKNLPAQMGEVLKKRLEQAEKDAKDLKSTTLSWEKERKKVEELEEKIREYQKFDDRYAELSNRESAVKEEERSLNIKTLEFQLNAEREKTRFTKEVALGLVRNTEFRSQVYDNKHEPGYTNSTGQWVCDRNHSSNRTEEHEAK